MTDTSQPLALQVAHMRRRQRARQTGLNLFLLTLVAVGFVLTLMSGHTFIPLGDVIRSLLGETIAGASFAVVELRFPRAVLSILTGMCFGMGGVAFQTMLRNPLASPDIIGISAGASASAVFAIVVLSLSGPMVSLIAVIAGLGVALAIYALSWRNGVTAARLILVGIGLSAMLQSLISYLLLRAPSWSLQEAMRWLMGSVNGAQLDQALPLFLALCICGGLLLAQANNLEALRMGDETAAGLGVSLTRTRITVIVSAVGLIAFAAAASGPIAFVSFLSGPIAARIAGRTGSLLIPAALVGAALVLFSDYAGQVLLPARYPVGVVTGVLGAPYLIYLITRAHKTGGAL